MSYDHASSLSVDENGAFHLTSPYGKVDETKPNGYQLSENSSESVKCGFTLNDNTVSFGIGNYDRTRDLYIDPQRLWGTFIGGHDTSTVTELSGLAVDRTGSADVTGYTNSTANIATIGAYQTTYGGGSYDAFIARFGSDGSIRWATYYGGDSADYSYGISSDSGLGMVITGETFSKSAIATPGSYQSTFGPGTDDAFWLLSTAQASEGGVPTFEDLG